MKIKIVFILLCSFLLTGCWNYNELNNLAISTGMSIDKDEDQYSVGILVSNTKKQGNSNKDGESKTVVLKGTGHTIYEAIQDLTLKSPKKIYIGHLIILVISEEVAKEGISDTIDFLLRDPVSRKNFYVILAKDNKAIDMLKIIPPLTSFSSQDIAINIKSSSEQNGIINALDFNMLLTNILEDGIEPSINSINIDGEVKKGEDQDNLKKSEPDAILKLGNLGIFREDRFIKWVSNDVSIGINLFNGIVKHMYTTVKCDEGDATIYLNQFKYKKKNTLNNNNPMISLDIDVIGLVNEITCDVSLNDPKTAIILEKEIEKKIRTYLNLAIDEGKKEKTDVLGLGKLFYQNNYAYWKKVKHNWNDDILQNVSIDINVNVKLKNKGSAKNTIKEAMNE